MNSDYLARAKAKIVLAANILVIVGIILCVVDVGMSWYQSNIRHLFYMRIPFIGTLLIILGIFLKIRGFVATRRVSFVIAFLLAAVLFVPVADLQIMYLSHMPFDLVKLQYISLAGLKLACIFVISLAIVSWVYILLSSRSIRQAAAEENVPYAPYWRYGPSRGFILFAVLGIGYLLFFASYFTSLRVNLISVQQPMSNFDRLNVDPTFSRWVASFGANQVMKDGEPVTVVETNLVYFTKDRIIGTYRHIWPIYKETGKTFKTVLANAKEGKKESQYELALMYYFNLGPNVSPNKGFEWALRAAKAGVRPAENFVARAYLTGLGTPVDQEKGKEWLEKFKDNNEAAAQENIPVVSM